MMVSFWMFELKTQMVKKMMVAIPQVSIQNLLKMLTMKQKLGAEKPFVLMSMKENYLKHQQRCNNFEQHKTKCKTNGPVTNHSYLTSWLNQG